MPSTEDHLAAITQHSHGLASAARDHLTAPVEHCPGWTVADLVWHVTEVHWFWGTIVGELLSEPPDDSRRPARAPDDGLVEAFLAGAQELVDTLRAADQSAACWTWATQKDVAFVTRHQVQEAAVHHWDVANATGGLPGPEFIDDAAAADAVDEFLTFSVSTDDDPVDRPALDGELWFCGCVSAGPFRSWVVTDGRRPGTVAFRHEHQTLPEAATGGHVSSGDLLLWLYARTPSVLSTFPEEDHPLVQRFRALSFTD
ncbi:MAG: hypothetical protein JWR85_2709 [Marmoricola sp.]|nr:hypothetical protein [Marmoricola sp.]